MSHLRIAPASIRPLLHFVQAIDELEELARDPDKEMQAMAREELR